jgi:hypothetical protein
VSRVEQVKSQGTEHQHALILLLFLKSLAWPWFVLQYSIVLRFPGPAPVYLLLVHRNIHPEFCIAYLYSIGSITMTTVKRKKSEPSLEDRKGVPHCSPRGTAAASEPKGNKKPKKAYDSKGGSRVKKKSKANLALPLDQQILFTLKQYHRCDKMDVSYEDITKHCGHDKDDEAWIAAFQELQKDASIIVTSSSDQDDSKQSNYEITKRGMARVSSKNGVDMDPKLLSQKEYETWMKSALEFSRGDDIFDCLKEHGALHRKDIAAKLGIHDGSHAFNYAFKEIREFGLINLTSPASFGKDRLWCLSAKAFLHQQQEITEQPTKCDNKNEKLNKETRKKSKERKRNATPSEGVEMKGDESKNNKSKSEADDKTEAGDDNNYGPGDGNKVDGQVSSNANQEVCRAGTQDQSSEVTGIVPDIAKQKNHKVEEDLVQSDSASINLGIAYLDAAEAENRKQENDAHRQGSFNAWLFKDSGSDNTPTHQLYYEFEENELYEEGLEWVSF